MKRITIILTFLLSFIAGYAQQGLRMNDLFEGRIIPQERLIETRIRGKALSKYQLSYYRSLRFKASEKEVADLRRLMNEDGTIRGMDKALIVDSCGTLFGSFLGTPAVTSYVESSSGVAEGGRTGLTAVTTGVLFLICLAFAPIVGVVQSYATAPALIIVGAIMAEDMTAIDFKDMTEALPAFLTMITMPLTYSIANGFGMGFISYVVLKTCTGRIREVSPIMWIVSVCFAISFVMR